jgi:hypothetical protein
MRRSIALATSLLFAGGVVTAFEPPVVSLAPSVGAMRPATKWHDDPNAAWREAFAAGKPMFLVVSSKQCPACDKLKAGALASPEFRAWVESRFVPVVILAEDHPHVVEKMAVRGYPTTVVIAPKVGVVHTALGAFNAGDFQRKFSLAEAAAQNPTR